MSNINWFPGHMAKALREIKEKKDLIDCFIVVLDSRAPFSSYNEEFDKIAPNKSRLFVLSKKELSDINRINSISNRFNNENDHVIAVNLKDVKSRQQILNKLKIIHQKKREKDKKRGLISSNLKCFVIGMPNVGKSTLINLLVKNKKLKVANMPGTTKKLQWIQVDNIYLMDSPGIMIPKIDSDDKALKLVATNLIKKEVISDYDFVIKIQDILIKKNEESFDKIGIEYFENENDKYSEIINYGRKNNILQKGNIVDEKKVFQIIRDKIINLKNIFWD
ncbi:MAG: ribosome biogenesis GTPase YlqF [Metamycoplasmataceae bacterium]